MTDKDIASVVGVYPNASSAIRVAIVCEPKTTVLADSLEAQAQGVDLQNFRKLFNPKIEVDQGAISDLAQVRFSGSTQTNNQRK